MATGSRQSRAAGFAIVALLMLAMSGRISGWASVSRGADTHQSILRQAYALLRADPGYHDSAFPALDDILAHEGVTTSALLDIRGAGPDATTPYSWHYYNPRRQEGNGPAAAACYFAFLQRALSGRPDPSLPAACQRLPGDTALFAGPPAKWAAYLAHFVADQSVPYHTNGMMVSPVAGVSTMPPAGVVPSNAGSIPWAQSLGVWNGLAQKPDWFDPWYWDVPQTRMLPELAKEATSTHAAWERVAAGASASGTSNAFVAPIMNAAAGNGRVAAADVEAFCRWRASGSQMSGNQVTSSPASLLAQAIQDVHTAWRASLSALRPSIEIAYNEETGAQDVTLTVENVDVTAARDVSVSLELVKGAGEVLGPRGMTLAKPIGPLSQQAVQKVWAVGPLEPRIRLRATVQGKFDRVPDSGDVVVERDFVLPAQTLIVSVVEAGTMKTGAGGVPQAKGLAARVTITPAFGGPPLSQQTDGTGSARFDNVVMGIYKATATAADHESGEAKVVVDMRLPRALATIALASSKAAMPGAVQQAIRQALPTLEDLPAGIIWQRKNVDYGETSAVVEYDGSQKADPYELLYFCVSRIQVATPQQIDEYSKELKAALQQPGARSHPGLPDSFVRPESQFAYVVTAPRGRSFFVRTYFRWGADPKIAYPVEKDTKGMSFEEKQREAYRVYLERRKADAEQFKFEEWARAKMADRSAFALSEAGRLATIIWSRLPETPR